MATGDFPEVRHYPEGWRGECDWAQWWNTDTLDWKMNAAADPFAQQKRIAPPPFTIEQVMEELRALRTEVATLTARIDALTTPAEPAKKEFPAAAIRPPTYGRYDIG